MAQEKLLIVCSIVPLNLLSSRINYYTYVDRITGVEMTLLFISGNVFSLVNKVI